jgi:hypothetical protein
MKVHNDSRLEIGGALGKNASIPAQRMRHLAAGLRRGPEVPIWEVSTAARGVRNSSVEAMQDSIRC